MELRAPVRDSSCNCDPQLAYLPPFKSKRYKHLDYKYEACIGLPIARIVPSIYGWKPMTEANEVFQIGRRRIDLGDWATLVA
jgi:hypothetical protein